MEKTSGIGDSLPTFWVKSRTQPWFVLKKTVLTPWPMAVMYCTSRSLSTWSHGLPLIRQSTPTAVMSGSGRLYLVLNRVSAPAL